MNLPFGKRRYAQRQRTAEHLAEAYTIGHAKGREAYLRGEEIAERPLTIDPQTTEGSYVMGFLAGFADRQWEQDECWLADAEASVVAGCEALLREVA